MKKKKTKQMTDFLILKDSGPKDEVVNFRIDSATVEILKAANVDISKTCRLFLRQLAQVDLSKEGFEYFV